MAERVEPGVTGVDWGDADVLGGCISEGELQVAFCLASFLAAAASAEAERVWCSRAADGDIGTAIVVVLESSIVFLRMVSKRSGRSRWNLAWLNSHTWLSGAPRIPRAVLLSFEKPSQSVWSDPGQVIGCLRSRHSPYICSAKNPSDQPIRTYRRLKDLKQTLSCLTKLEKLLLCRDK